MNEKDKLCIIWTSDNRDSFINMIAMYAHNAKKRSWFKEVNMIIWGPSARLVSEDKEIQMRILQMIQDGISFEACMACTDNYGVSAKLKGFGVDVKYMGVPLTEYLKSEDKVVLSF